MEYWLICVNKFFHFAVECYFISKSIGCFWCILAHLVLLVDKQHIG